MVNSRGTRLNIMPVYSALFLILISPSSIIWSWSKASFSSDTLTGTKFSTVITPFLNFSDLREYSILIKSFANSSFSSANFTSNHLASFASSPATADCSYPYGSSAIYAISIILIRGSLSGWLMV